MAQWAPRRSQVVLTLALPMLPFLLVLLSVVILDADAEFCKKIRYISILLRLILGGALLLDDFQLLAVRTGGSERRHVVGGPSGILGEISFLLVRAAPLLSVVFVVLLGIPTFSVLLNTVNECCRNLVGG